MLHTFHCMYIHAAGNWSCASQLLAMLPDRTGRLQVAREEMQYLRACVTPDTSFVAQVANTTAANTMCRRIPYSGCLGSRSVIETHLSYIMHCQVQRPSRMLGIRLSDIHLPGQRITKASRRKSKTIKGIPNKGEFLKRWMAKRSNSGVLSKILTGCCAL